MEDDTKMRPLVRWNMRTSYILCLTKTTIKKVLGHSYVTYETLQTVVTEINSMINDTLLTYVTSGTSDDITSDRPSVIKRA